MISAYEDMGLDYDMNKAWFVGILEGEGCFSLKNDKYISIAVEMTDLDVITKLKELSGVGKIHMRTKRGGRKQSWIWTVATRPDVEHILQLTKHMFSQRRREQINYLLQATTL